MTPRKIIRRSPISPSITVVPVQPDAFYMMIFFAFLFNCLPGIITASILNQYNLEIFGDFDISLFNSANQFFHHTNAKVNSETIGQGVLFLT